MERRQSIDRRQRQHHPLLCIHALRGRRRHCRRTDDERRHPQALDWYHPKLLAMVLLTLLLCLADAHNTIQLLGDGAQEMNAFMDYLIHRDAGLFILTKLGITAAALIVLVSYHHLVLFNLFKVRHVIYSIFAMYVALVAYELSIWPGEGVPLVLIPHTG
ncbi:MAG TPA: hypothetical protein ENJ19_10700 [Gammaproteobacteria bacterium]|nr:hypothetical protein [Gammaproteobacteria bacterium]